MQPFRPDTPFKNITIIKRLRWRGWNRPGDRGAATFLGGGNGVFWGGLMGVGSKGITRPGGRIRLHHPVASFNTPQSISDRVGAVRIDRGIVGRLRLWEGGNGVLGRVGGVWIEEHFATGRAN